MNTNNGDDPLIPRNELLVLLNSHSNKKLMHIHAPAGYGKTTTVSQLLNRDSRRHAFLALDEYDNALSYFCEHFRGALLACQPDNEPLRDMLSHPGFGGAPEEFTLRGIMTLSDKKRAVIAIDDFHLVTAPDVQRFILAVIKRLPENFQTITAGRHELPDGFSELFLKDTAVYIANDRFIFSEEEIAALYKKRGRPITGCQAREIREQTHGWAFGINTFLLSGGDNADGRAFDFLHDFIRANVWDKWDEPTREFILRTAQAHKLEPRLCTALTGVKDSERLLNDLTRRGAFITKTNDGSYRYHHIFQNFLKTLQEERGGEFQTSLLIIEGNWYLSQYDFYGAADCFIRAKNHAGIAKCFDLLEVADRNDFLIERILPILKHPEILALAEKYPHLHYMIGWCALIEGRGRDMASSVDSYYARYAEIAAGNPKYAHNLFYMRLWDHRLSVMQWVKELELIPASREVKGVQATITLNMPMFHRSTLDYSDITLGNMEENLKRLNVTGWLLGDEREIIFKTIAACLYYEQGNMEKAYTHALDANAEIREGFSPELKFSAMTILVCVLDALSEYNEAEKVLEAIGGMIERDRSYHLNRNYKLFTARRGFGQGNAETARTWLNARPVKKYESVLLYQTYEIFTECRARMAAGEYDNTIIPLTKLLVLAGNYNRPLDVMEAHILLAVIFWRKRRSFQNAALEHLEAALQTAYPFGYTQMFVNDGAALSAMLFKLKKRFEQHSAKYTVSVSFINKLYMLTRDASQDMLVLPEEPYQKFTDKQKAVMRVLCEGKSYREASEILGIKLTTLRSHIKLIYKKLGVTNQTDAITRIQKYGRFNE